MDRKQKQVERYLKGAKRARSLAERKELEQRSRERRSHGNKRPRRATNDWDAADEDELEGFEAIQRAPKVRPDELARAVAARAAAEDAGAEAVEPELAGLVVGVAPGRVRVRLEQDGDVEEAEAVLGDALARTQRSSVAVGDVADLEERGDGSLRVRAVLPRRSLLSRPDPQDPRLERVVAANVDVAVIVAAVREPALRHRLVDRYLVAVQRGGVEPLVCANKADLLGTPEERAEVEAVLDVYRELGVPVQTTSTATGEGVDALRAALRGRTVVLVGQSGVGKSSLLNAVAPELGLVTGRVRTGDGKGRHTTTGSSLHVLSDGTRLIDTPGVRSFGLAHVTRASLADFFPEFAAPAAACRFGDCTHSHEPDCGVRAAVERGEVAALRHDTYLRLLASL